MSESCGGSPRGNGTGEGQWVPGMGTGGWLVGSGAIMVGSPNLPEACSAAVPITGSIYFLVWAVLALARFGLLHQLCVAYHFQEAIQFHGSLTPYESNHVMSHLTVKGAFALRIISGRGWVSAYMLEGNTTMRRKSCQEIVLGSSSGKIM